MAYSRLQLVTAIQVPAAFALVLGSWSAVVMDDALDRVLTGLAAVAGAVVLLFVLRWYRRPVDPLLTG
jgi:hypothetical protein